MKKGVINHLFSSLMIGVMLANSLVPYYVQAGDDSVQTDEVVMQSDDADKAADSDWYKIYKYTLDEDLNTITLESYDNSVTELEIPAVATINGKTYDVWLSNALDLNSGTAGLGKGLFSYNNSLKKLTIDDGVHLVDGKEMFVECDGIDVMDVSGLKTDSESFQSMEEMFCNMNSLKSLEWGKFDTSNVVNMCGVFSGSYNIPELDLRVFNTSKVKDMSRMFNSCQGLRKVDLSSFDTSNVENFGSMFSNCIKLKEFDVSHFDTSNATNMDNMFASCAVENLDVKNFNTSKVISMSNMFAWCTSLTELDLSRFDTSNVVQMYGMFIGSKNIKELDLSNFNTSNVTDMRYMFAGCSGLESIDLSSFDTSKVKYMDVMFSQCESLRELDLSNFNMVNVLHGDDMLQGCTSLYKIKTPVNVSNNMSIALPVTMTDKEGNKYDYLPNGDASAVSIELYADRPLEPDDKQELNLENLTYSFNNSRETFGYSNPYKIPIDSFKYLFGDNVKAKYYYKQQKPWQGSCMGFSGTSALLFDDDNGLYTTTFSDNAKKISDLTPTLSSNALGINVTRFIEVMQISQKTEQIASDLVNNKVFSFDLESGKRSLNSMYGQIKDSCSKNEPVVLALWQGGYGHALLAYKTEEFSDTENRVYIYDSNKPEENVYVTFKKNANGNLVSWIYDMGGYGIWGTDNESSISYVPYNTLNEVWKLRGKLGETKNTASFNSKDFAVYDAEDKLVATVTDGVLNTENSDIYMLFDDLSLDDVPEDEMVTLVMPIDVYTIKNNNADLDNFHFEVVDTMQGLTVDTTADEVVLVVADDFGLNSVQLDASADDSYSISLDSSIEDDIASVCVTGTGSLNGEMVEISQNAGEVTVGNGVVSSLIYDGEEMITYTVSANAGQGGTIDPSGIKTVVKGSDQLYTITADAGYEIADVMVDGFSVGAVSEYLFQDVDKDHSIEARFFKNDMHTVVGEKQTIKLEKGKNPVKEWIVDNENIAKLSAKQKRSCKITGLSEGIVCITGLDKNKEVVIQKYLRVEKPVLADQVIRSGEEFSAGAFITGVRDCRPTKYSSSKSSVIKIDKKTGTASAKKNGTAKVTVWYGNAKYSAAFEVKMPVISEKKTTVKLSETKTLEIANALEDASYRWESSKESVVTVSEEGILTPVKKGKAKITMYYTVNGKEYAGSSCTVTIKK